MRKLLPALLLVTFAASNVRAELPLIRLDRVTPLGGKAGSEVTLEIAGRDLEDAKTLHFDHPGFKAAWLKDRQFKVTIAADVPPGTYEVRVVGRFGISGVRLFAVQHGLTEVAEKEPNDDAKTAQVVPMNCAINLPGWSVRFAPLTRTDLFGTTGTSPTSTPTFERWR